MNGSLCCYALSLILTVVLCGHLEVKSDTRSILSEKFPENFLFGAGVSSFQTEGAWDEDGKALSVLEKFFHDHPEKVYERQDAKIACDSYHKREEDVRIMKELGLQSYRFSISWGRILPRGFEAPINWAGIDHYNAFIDLLVESNIIPIVTMYHWDLPQELQDMGGLTNSLFIEWFENYARLLFEHFGDRVKIWMTFNQPDVECQFYESEDYPPEVVLRGMGTYLCARNLLLAHARTYRMYHQEFAYQNGQLGLANSIAWLEPATYSPEDLAAVERFREFELGMFAHPIYEGDFPQIVKDAVDKNSAEEGFRNSRLPKFTSQEIELLKGSADFFGVNYYSAYLIKSDDANCPRFMPSFAKDVAVKILMQDSWPKTAVDIFRITPWALRRGLKYVKEVYGNPEIYITENGFGETSEDLQDHSRVNFIREHLAEILKSIHLDDVKIRAYIHWSFMDNFEWTYGYSVKFGLYSVNFTDPERRRTPKQSATFYKNVIKSRSINVVEIK